MARDPSKLEELCLAGQSVPSLERAFRDVRGGKTPLERQTSRGGDGVTICDFCRERTSLLPELAHELATGSYERLELKEVFERKDDGGYRRILMPTVRDRVVGRMVLNSLEYLRDELPTECAGAGTSLEDIIEDVNDALGDGWTYVVRTDIVKYFDNIDRKLLDPILRKAIGNDFVWELALQILEHPDGHGVPQGSSLSSFAANFFLRDMDDDMGRIDGLYRRYVDDILIVCGSSKAAKRWSKRVERWCRTKGLRRHRFGRSPRPGKSASSDESKSKAADVGVSPLPFLGFEIASDGVRALPKKLAECGRRAELLADDAAWEGRTGARRQKAVSLHSTLRQMATCGDERVVALLEETQALCDALTE